MPGVPRELAEHSLDVSKMAKPLKQKLRRFVKDRKEVIRIEVLKLLAAGFIRECKKPGLARQPGACTQENRPMENVYRLHRPQSPLP
jgi:hypothetical protein